MENLRIAQVINSLLSAGAEKLVVETTKRFVKAGHKVDLILLKYHKTDLYEEVQQMEGVRIFNMLQNGSIYNPLISFKIAFHLKNVHYDIVHVHLFPGFYWAAFFRPPKKNTKYIYTEHNTHNRRMGNAFYRAIDNLVYPRYDCHIAISNTVREKLEEHINKKKNKIITIFNGIDLKSIQTAEPYPKSEFNLGYDDKMILQVSAFRPQKNQITLIKALCNLPSNNHVFFAGTGVLLNNCQEVAKELGVEKRVHFLGVRNDVPRLLKTADMVVLSSNYEGLSLSSVEGLASGKPFIASDVPGLTEVVKDAGVLFENGDAKGLAIIISELLADDKFYRNTITACLKRSKMYDIETMSAAYLNLYKEVLGQENK